ncbi:MAG: ABC transporter permease [Firmicutes bacterium]|nr:ABC transporter permease [Bacillota bacterium]
MSNEGLNRTLLRVSLQGFTRAVLLSRLSISILAILLLFVLGEVILPGFMSFSHVMSILRLSVFLGIVTLGQTLVVISGEEGIDLSVGSVVSLGVVISAYLLNGQDINIPKALIFVPAVGLGIGLLSGLAISYIQIPPIIMTLAMASVVEGTSLIITRGFPTGSAPRFLEIIGSGKVLNVPYLILLWVLAILSMTFVLAKTRWGSILYGVGSNSLTAELSGVMVRRFRVFVYGACGAIACAAGLLVLSYTGTPYLNLGATYTMPSIAAVAIGGISLAGGSGNYIGAVTGCIILTTLNSILVALRTTEAVRQITFGLLLLILIISYTSRRKGGR